MGPHGAGHVHARLGVRELDIGAAGGKQESCASCCPDMLCVPCRVWGWCKDRREERMVCCMGHHVVCTVHVGQWHEHNGMPRGLKACAGDQPAPCP